LRIEIKEIRDHDR